MKSFKKAIVSILIVVLFGSAMCNEEILKCFSDFNNTAYAATTVRGCPNYTINGVTVNEDSVGYQDDGGCVRYAKAMYKILWGVEYNNKFIGDSETGYNMLCELSGEERKITAESAKNFISQAALGAVIRTEDTDTSADGGEGYEGHSLIIVEKTEDGFTALEHWTSNQTGGVTQKYTWEEFASPNDNGSYHAYFKYIKWPNAPVYTEYITGSCGENVTYTFDKSTGTLTISGTGDMEDHISTDGIPSIEDIPWRDYAFLIKSIVIGNGVTNVGCYAFCGCINLTSVTIPDSVTSIGDWAFWNCESLEYITIPDSVTSIGDWAFWDCESLDCITIPDSVTSIGAFSFYSTALYNDSSNWENDVLYISNH